MIKTKIRKIEIIDPKDLYFQLGKKIKFIRESHKESQQDLGNFLGMTRANVANLEAGKIRILLEHIYNIALYYKIDIIKLLP